LSESTIMGFLVRLRSLVFPILLMLALGTAAAGETETAIGQVVFVAGEASLQRGPQSLPIGKALPVQEGDWIKTGANGHVHLRMQDNGFIAVRPGSRLQIRQYQYKPDTPEANRVLLHLESGVARTTSGKAGEANKERYRFTTPVAAIGLRGTDYVVLAEPDLTRVNVLRGAIVLNPLGAGCSADLISPCATPYMRELSAQTPSAYLEVRMRGSVPEINLRENGQGALNPQTKPHPEEPQAKMMEREALLAMQSSSANATPQPPPAIVWGRWQHVATPTPTLVSQLNPEREMTYGNELFGLLRSAAPVTLPQGAVGMRYDAGEAWLKTGQGNLLPVQLGQGTLHLDFDQRQFRTSLVAALPDASQQLQAQGSITFQGNLLSDANRSNMNVAGVITSQAQEAGYLFDSKQADGILYGATRWKR
jgi:hypothetical protein